MISMPPSRRRPHSGLAVVTLFVGVLAGCGPHIACSDFAPKGGECERIAEAALPEVPPGATTLTVDGRVGSGVPAAPNLVVACYPEGTAVAVAVTLTADGADVRPWTGQLPFECDR